MLPQANLGPAHAPQPFLPPPPSQPMRMPPSSQPPSRQQRARSAAPYPLPVPRAGPSDVPRRMPPVDESQLLDLLDGPYHPPSSQPTPSPAPAPAFRIPPPPGPVTPTHRGRREESVPRPSSSLSGSIPPQHPYAPQPSVQGVIDRYRPPSAIPVQIQNGYSSSQPQRSGAQVYQAAREPKPAKGAEILAALAETRQWLADKFDRRDEEDKEYREQLHDRFKALEEENRDLKERIHELSMGQRVLPTREEMSEEITNQLSPALHEFFESVHHTVRKTIEPLAAVTAAQCAQKIKLIMLEFKDTEKREALQASSTEQPLTNLMNVLIKSVGDLHSLSNTLRQMDQLPSALENIAVFQNTMQLMKDRFSPPPGAKSSAGHDQGNLISMVQNISNKVDDMKRTVELLKAASVNSEEHARLVSLVESMARQFGKVGKTCNPAKPIDKTMVTFGQTASTFQPSTGSSPRWLNEIARSAIGNHRGQPGSFIAACAPHPSLSTPAATEVPALNLIPATGDSPAEVTFDGKQNKAARNAIIQANSAVASPALLNRGYQRDLIGRPTTPTALRGTSIGAGHIDGFDGDFEDDDDAMSPEPSCFTGLLFPQNSPAAQPIPPMTRAPVHNRKRRLTGVGYDLGPRPTDLPPPAPTTTETYTAEPETIAQMSQTQPSTPTALQPNPAAPSAFDPTAPAPINTTSGHTNTPPAQLPTIDWQPERAGSSSSKRRKANTVAVKQENLNLLRQGTFDRAMTRAETSKAKAMGLDVIEVIKEVGNSSSRSTSNGSSGSKSQKGKTTETGPHQPAPGATRAALGPLLQETPAPQREPETIDIDTMPPAALSRTTSTMDLDFGHGQAPLFSVPSVPQFESTDDMLETQEPTQANTQPTTGKQHQEESTSTDRVDESVTATLATPPRSGATRRPPPPSYRKYQRAHSIVDPEMRSGWFTRAFGALDDSDDE